ncbi:hypothetical protein NO135_25340, partial [Clostridioides difficile]|nr:hypothetical protein [Clostridioides difficile]
ATGLTGAVTLVVVDDPTPTVLILALATLPLHRFDGVVSIVWLSLSDGICERHAVIIDLDAAAHVPRVNGEIW